MNTKCILSYPQHDHEGFWKYRRIKLWQNFSIRGFIVLLFCNLSIKAIAGNGLTCDSAKIASVGLNLTDSVSFQWYKYTATKTGKTVISTCGLTNVDAQPMVYADCNYTYIDQILSYCPYPQRKLEFAADSGQSYLIFWQQYSFSPDTFSWMLSEETFGPGETCGTAVNITPGIQNAASLSVQWFKYTAQQSGKVEISTCGLTSLSSLFANTYEGSCSILTYVNANWESCGSQFKRSFFADSGKTYWIKFQNYGPVDTFSWSLNEAMPLPGEFCTAPKIANAGVNIADSMAQQWFKFTATRSGKITISNCGSSTFSYITVYSDCSYSNIPTNDSSCDGSGFIFEFLADSGSNYYVEWHNIGSFSSFEWTLVETDPEPGDFCQTAINVSEGINHVSSQNQWHKFTATKNGKIEISTCGLTSVYASVMTYSSCGTPLSSIYLSCGGSGFKRYFLADSGATYYLKWYAGDTLSYRLTQKTPKPGEFCGNSAIPSFGINVGDNTEGDQWFRFIPDFTGKIAITSCGLTNKNTYVFLYKGSCNALTYQSHNDNNCGLQSEIVYTVDSGVVYYIQWRNIHSINDTFLWGLYKYGVLPGPISSISGPANVCSNQTNFEYSMSPVDNAAYYQWSFLDDTIQTNSPTLSIYKFPAGKDTVTLSVYAVNPYGHSDTATLEIIITQTPEKPSITRSGNVLSSNSAIGNQWYTLSGPIAGATQQIFTVTSEGSYYVKIFNGGCASEASDTITVLIDDNAIVASKKAKIQIYPNPAKNILTISPNDTHEKINYEVYNALGVIVLKGQASGKFNLSVHHLKPGIYSLKLMVGNNTHRLQFLKE